MSEHTTDAEDCWCRPTVEVQPNGCKVIIHNERRFVVDHEDLVLFWDEGEGHVWLTETERQQIRRRLME